MAYDKNRDVRSTTIPPVLRGPLSTGERDVRLSAPLAAPRDAGRLRVVMELPQPHLATSSASRGEFAERSHQTQGDDRRELSEKASRPSLSAKHPRIRILLADDHRILRLALATILRDEQDLEVVGEAGDGQEAVELAARCHPDVILMDVTMPRLSGIEATRQITAAWPRVRVIGLSMHEEDGMAAQMRAAGAIAYLTKGGSAEELLDTIRRESTTPRRVSL